MASQGYASHVNQNQSFVKRLIGKIKWLFTKNGLPVLLVLIVGFLVGFVVDGAIGVILSTIVGLALLTVFKKFRLPLKPWQETVSVILPIVARLCFIMVFFLPIADYLALPSGHTPNTLMKYLSIMVVIPSNIVSGAPSTNVYPGLPIVVAISVFLMFWGSLNLGKRKNFIIAFIGLLLYTLSPTIASSVSGYPSIRILFSFFSIGYYLAWAGLILMVINRFLPKIIGSPTQQQLPPPPPAANRLMSLAPIFGLALFLPQLISNYIDISWVALQTGIGFEEAHHSIAGFFSGCVAGVGAAAIVDSFVSDPAISDSLRAGGGFGDTSAIGSSPPLDAPPPTSMDIPPPPPPPQGETITYNDQFGNSMTATQQPDGTWINENGNIVDIDRIDEANREYNADRDWSRNEQQKEIVEDTSKAARDDQAAHQPYSPSDQTKNFWKGFLEQEQDFNSWQASHELKKAEGFGTLEKIAKGFKTTVDWTIWVGKYTVPGGRTVSDVYDVASEFAGSAADGKTGEGLAKGGIKTGQKMLKKALWKGLENKFGGESGAGQFIRYMNQDNGPATTFGQFVEDATKDKVKGAAPDALAGFVKAKTGLSK